MILVLLGTQANSFTRLLDEIQKAIDNKVITERVVVQAGFTKYSSKDMEILDLIPEEELAKLIEEARLVITHGGVGSILGAIGKNKKVIAIPRLKEYKEHVNNHQIQIVENFDKQCYIKGVFDINKLSETIEKINEFIPNKFISNTENFINKLEEYIRRI